MSQNQANTEIVTRVSEAVAAGTGDSNSSSVDMANLEGVKFYTTIGAIAGGGTAKSKVEQSDDDGVADDWTELEGSGIDFTDTDDNKVAIHDIYRPQKRYVRVTVERAGGTVAIDSILAAQYDASKAPTVDDATTVQGKVVLASPNEGTA